MNQPYIIFSDASADVSPDIAAENDIRFIPMSYTLGGEERICSGAEDVAVLKKFYEGQRNGDMTRTSQISPQVYIEIFSPFLKEGKSVLYLSLSSGLSGTYNSSCIAARELNEQYNGAEVVCVDTLSATCGMGLLLEKAVQNRRDGMTIHENSVWLDANKLRLCHWFMVDDLMYLKRGGRVSAATAVVGTALNIKPILKIDDDGTLSNFAKARGTAAALKSLVDYYASSYDGGTDNRAYIIHADNEKAADYLAKEIKRINPACNITTIMLGPIIGAHTGPGMCAVAHFGNRNK